MQRQELFCHNCNRYVQFNVPEIDGRLRLTCPVCGHVHYRIVTNGVITADRWGTSNLPIVYITSNITTSDSSTYNIHTASTGTAGTSFIRQSWLDSTTSATDTW